MFSSLPPARRRVLLWMAVGTLAVLLLAGGLGTFTLQPGKVFEIPAPTQSLPDVTPTTMPGGDVIMLIVRGILALFLILIPVTIVLSLFNKENRKRLITNLIVVALLFLLMDQIKPLQRTVEKTPTPQAAAGALGGLPGLFQSEPLPPQPPAPSDALALIASIALVLLAIGLAAWLGRRWLFPARATPIEQIAREAERAQKELSSGHGVEDAIIRTYRQMNHIVAEARELHRPSAATPREFEQYLVDKGLPRQPLAALTHLFEDVRYGGLAAGARERQAAIDALSAIAAACRAEPAPARRA